MTKAAASQEFLRAVGVHADRQVRLRQAQVGLGAQTHVGEQVGGVAAVGQLPAQGNVEADGEAGKVAGAAAGAQQHDLVELEPQRFEQFLRLRPG
jgi:hypothetical protein